MTSPAPAPIPSEKRHTSHLITVQHPLYPHFLVSTLRLRDSLFIWVGQASPHAAEEADRIEQGQVQGQNGSQAGVTPARTRPSDNVSEEAQRQAEVDRQVEEELERALAEAGRGESDGDGTGAGASLPKGVLAKEWAVAMWREGKPPTSTPLFQPPSSSLAASMSRRLAQRLRIQQIHLSLSLPPDMVPQGAMAGDPTTAMGMGVGMGEREALLALEAGIEEAVRDR